MAKPESSGTISMPLVARSCAQCTAPANVFTTEWTGTFSHSGSRMMLARPVAMVIFDDKQGTRSRRIYWHGVQ
jgi:hypothetical protein